MNLSRVDLNLLVYLDTLLRLRNVTQAANRLGISQPAMSNGLKRLRVLLDDPLLVRTSEGMSATDRARELAPQVRSAISQIEKVLESKGTFVPGESDRVFRIMASDYAESTLIPVVLKALRREAPNITLDVLTPSDATFADVEQGRIDMVINRFDQIPQSFHQRTVWQDSFSCLVPVDHVLLQDYSLENYLRAKHIWVSKTGIGAGLGVNPKDVQRLGWVDLALSKLGVKREITVFTRHYQVAILLAEQHDLIATMPTRMARCASSDSRVVLREPPLEIPPFDLKMVWSSIHHQNPAHRWLRQLIIDAVSVG